MTKPHTGQRGDFRVGGRVMVNARYIRHHPKSRIRGGALRNFCVGTMLYVNFDGMTGSTQIDERYVRPMNEQ